MLSRLLKIYFTWHLNTTCKWFQLNHAPGNNLLCNFPPGGAARGAGAAHASARIQFNISTNINAFRVYIFPVTSVWITLQRDDILRQGKPATLSRQSINQRKIIRNILHKAPGTRHPALGEGTGSGSGSGTDSLKMEMLHCGCSNAELALEKWATSAFWQPNKYKTSQMTDRLRSQTKFHACYLDCILKPKTKLRK